MDAIRLALRVDAEPALRLGRPPVPLPHRQRLLVRQLAHPRHRRIARRRREETRQQVVDEIDHAIGLDQRDPGIVGRRRARETEREHVVREGREPDVVRMIGRGERLAAVEQDREFGRQRAVARRREQRQQVVRQRLDIETLIGIDAGGRADHDVAGIVGRRLRRPEAGADHRLGHRGVVRRRDAADLQVGAVGRLDDAAAEARRDVGDAARLGRGQPAERQFDPADAAVARRHDAEQTRAGCGAIPGTIGGTIGHRAARLIRA